MNIFLFVKSNKLVQNLLLLLITTLLCLIVAEVFFRFFSDSRGSERFWLLSENIYTTTENGAVKFLPNLNVREIAIYDSQIEYDTRYKTNNLGFVDHKDYSLEDNTSYDHVLAIVGDSFSQGTGGYPWVPNLRDKLQQDYSVVIYNLGVGGTGVVHWMKILDDTDEVLNFDQVIISAVSDDFFRYYWTPNNTENSLFFVKNEEQLGESFGNPIAYFFNDPNMSQSDILLMSRKLPVSFKSKLVNNIILLHMFEKFYWQIFRDNPTSLYGSEYYNDSLSTLANIQQKYGSEKKVVFVHVPTKEELLRHHYAIDIKDAVENIGMIYIPALDDIELEQSNFHSRDGHPNESGYQIIEQYYRDLILKNIGG